ncbi:MAG: Gfo/Idh/MocA family oxidoreductase, partial [Clostridiales Family XIII bacterium]|nr:Gfo/Idh/MocA family oxidoreductase [Clostridiales Family XIII bacterium]
MAIMLKCGMVGGHLNAFIGEVHRKAMAFDTRAKLVAGCFSSDAAKNKETAEAYSIDEARTYATYAEMAEKEAANGDGIDLAIITTPNNTHYEIAKTFLAKGINVVCEKPLCFEVAEAEELYALAKEKNLIFAVTYTYTGYDMVKVAKEMVAEGKIGEIAAVNAEYAQDWLLDELSPENKGNAKNLSVWRTDPSKSGISNSVGDIGTHIEATVHYITGLRIKRLLATINRYGHELDLNANIITEYEGGVNGAYWCSQIAAGRLNGLVVRIYGTEGALEWEQEKPDFLSYTPRGQARQILSRGCGYLTEKAAGQNRLPCGHPEGLYVAFANIYRN